MKEIIRAYCLVCGSITDFVSNAPPDSLCKRNTFICTNCGSSSRNRHVAKVILDIFSTPRRANSISDFASYSMQTIFNTSASGALHTFLGTMDGYHGSEYFSDIPSGNVVNGIQCQDIQQTSFSDNSFDLVITEDILEHVPSPTMACDEIRRILKPGGWHVCTVPVFFEKECSVTRAKIEDHKIKHLLPATYHDDPLKKEKVLVFTDFGRDLAPNILNNIGETFVYTSHQHPPDEKKYAIYNSWVYASRKPDTKS